MKVYFQPQPNQWPERGGVREHLRQLYQYLQNEVELVQDPDDADILHVESSWAIPQTKKKKPTVYVCHGGFVPTPMPMVTQNLWEADRIVSVAKWLVGRYFPMYTEKTRVIPNGVTLSEFENIPGTEMQGYILYAKEWLYSIEDLLYLVYNRSDLFFVSTVWPQNVAVPDNVTIIGLQTQTNIRTWLKNAGCLLLTGSEVCPTMLLEAWACQTPVLAKAIDGSEELMSLNGDTVGGKLYINRSHLSNVVDNVLEVRDIYGNVGYEWVKESYQWKDLVKEYIRVYHELI